MSFSAEWLALREPADHASINPDVRAALVAATARHETLQVVDLGCGAGSNLRGTAAALGARQHWRLVDYDPALLSAAAARLPEWAERSDASTRNAILNRNMSLSLQKAGRDIGVSFEQHDLAKADFGALLAGAHLVTAAALFDLVSPAVMDRLAEAITGAGQVFATVLTYDGFAQWLPAHPADAAMRAAFNAHQGGDKGFGPAAGPAATGVLAEAFYRRGYRVLRGTSPWVLDARFPTLRRELDQGWAAAVRETGQVPAAHIDAWLAQRLTHGTGSIVGHEDFIAVPA
jgi:SAM-dependent methyltransferase